jgi:uncharacterized protein (TIGR02147 family)
MALGASQHDRGGCSVYDPLVSNRPEESESVQGRRTDDPDVFDFLDYRAYLREFYRRRKEQSSFSYRAFSLRAKLGSPNYLKLVIDGERNLTAAMARRFAGACGLKGPAATFFCELVIFGQASTLDERNESYGRLKRFQEFRQAQEIQIARDEYHSRWYLPAIRELALAQHFRPDPEWIAAQLWPPIRVSEAKNALEILQKLEMLVPRAEGGLEPHTPLVTTGPETANLHVAQYHRTMMTLASESLERIPAASRDISSVTLCVGEDGLDLIKQAIIRFRRELLTLSELERTPRQVVQVNFQLFPLSVLTKGSE